MKRTIVLGTEIDTLSYQEAIDRALREMHTRNSAYVVTPNSEMILKARKSRELRAAIRGAALSLPDGVGVLAASRILGTPIRERITGIDFAVGLLEKMAEREKSVFLLGARDGVAEAAADRLCEQYPGLVIAGTNNGYFDMQDENLLLDRINSASPDLLLVCLGSPKQELWMHRCAHKLQVGLMAGLGGALDVFAGRVRRAPEAWRRLGLEWLYRLIEEPWRIARVIRIPQLFFASIWYKIGGL